VAQIVEPIGSSDFAEVNDAGVFAVEMENVRGVEIAVDENGMVGLKPRVEARDCSADLTDLSVGQEGPQDREVCVELVEGKRAQRRELSHEPVAGWLIPPNPAKAFNSDFVDARQVSAGFHQYRADISSLMTPPDRDSSNFGCHEYRPLQINVEGLEIDDFRHPHSPSTQSLVDQRFRGEACLRRLGEPKVEGCLPPAYPENGRRGSSLGSLNLWLPGAWKYPLREIVERCQFVIRLKQ
jgi:hypothetical protein